MASFLRALLSVVVAMSEILQLIIAPELSLSKIIKTAPSTLFSNSSTTLPLPQQAEREGK